MAPPVIGDLKGKVVIVSGGNSGIGYHTVLQLVAHGARVYLGARDESKASEALKRLEKDLAATGEKQGSGSAGEAIFLQLDLSTIAGTKASAKEFLSKETRLDLLINNAGKLNGPFELNSEGISTMMATNHFGTFAFTDALLPLLIKTSREPGADVRIVTVSSRMAMMMAPNDAKFATLEDINQPFGKDDFMGSQRRYSVSKLANLLFTNELQKRLDAQSAPIIAISLHPGLVASEGYHAAAASTGGIFGFLGRVAGALMAISPAKGAWTTLFAATSPKVREDPKKYGAAFLDPYDKVVKLSGRLKDEKLAADLWALSESIVATK